MNIAANLFFETFATGSLLGAVLIILYLLESFYLLSECYTSAYSLGCMRPKKNPFFGGLSLVINVRKRFQRHTVVPGQADLHKVHGSTFEVTGPLSSP